MNLTFLLRRTDILAAEKYPQTAKRKAKIFGKETNLISYLYYPSTLYFLRSLSMYNVIYEKIYHFERCAPPWTGENGRTKNPRKKQTRIFADRGHYT